MQSFQGFFKLQTSAHDTTHTRAIICRGCCVKLRLTKVLDWRFLGSPARARHRAWRGGGGGGRHHHQDQGQCCPQGEHWRLPLVDHRSSLDKLAMSAVNVITFSLSLRSGFEVAVCQLLWQLLSPIAATGTLHTSFISSHQCLSALKCRLSQKSHPRSRIPVLSARLLQLPTFMCFQATEKLQLVSVTHQGCFSSHTNEQAVDIFRPQVGCHLVSFHPHRVSHPRYISNHCDGKEILFSTIKIFHRYFPPSNPSQSSLAGGFSPTDGALRCCWASQDSTQSRQLYSWASADSTLGHHQTLQRRSEPAFSHGTTFGARFYGLAVPI